jgi:hypothetical protein
MNLRRGTLARGAGQWSQQLGVGEAAARDLVATARMEEQRLSEVIDTERTDADLVRLASPVSPRRWRGNRLLR